MRVMLLLLGLTGSLLVRADDARFSLYVFDQGRPVAEVQLYVDGQQVAETTISGAIRIQLAPGEHLLRLVREGNTLLERPMQSSDGETEQWIVAIGEDGVPQLAMESSHSDDSPQLAGEAPAETASGPPGTLSGVLLSEEDGEPVANARIFVSGNPAEARSDAEGRFSLALPPGSYSLSVLHTRYNTRTLDEVQIASGEETSQQLQLTPSGSELPEYVVVEPFIAGSLASVLDERRNEAAVSNILGSDQISKAGDSDAAGALKRVTGLTLVDGKFIYVRGLGERYSATLLNGANVPSPDPTRRVVPLDLFPAGIIESISVQKGFTPDLPGEFGGGTVQIRTKTVPEQSFFNVDWSLGYNNQTTGKDGLSYAGGGRDWSGYDDGSRAMPDLLAEAIADNTKLVEENPFIGGGFSEEELEAIGESLPGNYDVTPETVGPDFGFSAAGGTRFEFEQGPVLGLLAAVDYGNSWTTIDDQRRTSYSISSGDQLMVRDDFRFNTTERVIDLSGFLTVGLEWGENQTVAWNWTMLRNTLDQAQIEQGIDSDASGGEVRFTQQEWEEREMLSNQLLGKHVLPIGNGVHLDWQYTTADAKSDIPAFIRYRYDPDERTLEDQSDFLFSARNDSNQRRWSDLDDNSDNYNIDLLAPLPVGDNSDLSFSLGLADVDKSRQSAIRRFQFRRNGSLITNDLRDNESVNDIINADTIDPNGWQILDLTQATDSYTADQVIEAWYWGMDFTWDEKLRLAGGIRNESSNQNVITFDPFAPDNRPIISELDTDDRFPAFTVTGFLPGDHQIRAGYAETINRPDFTELAEVVFRDALLDRLVIGNPDLEAAYITHWDLRWDKYFTPGEFVSVGLFYKEFENPIENVVLAGAAALVSFDNAQAAENLGVEVELYKDFSFLGDRWADFYINTNYSWIDSEITLNDEASSIQTSDSRPLQGQSPYVFNLQLGYDSDENGISAALLYNEFGKRILDVGISGAPDIYQQPFRQLDLVYSQEFRTNWKFKVKLNNLLDDEVLLTQGSEVTRSYTKGREISLGLEWRAF